jgi:drug/metabolite transporter (DMT)-like permease
MIAAPMQPAVRSRDVAAIVLTILFQTGAVAFGKQAAIALPHFTPGSIVRNGFYLVSLLCLGLQAITWQLALARFPLSYAYSAMSIVYVNVLVISVIVFGERVTPANVAGAALIMTGVALVARYRKNEV